MKINKHYINNSNSLNLNILGAGLVCLDIIKERSTTFYLNGGTCGNVITALSILGWNSSVIINNYTDKAGEIINRNLNYTGVKQIKAGNRRYCAPRVIEELVRDNYKYINHRFFTTCPECGKKLPSVKPVSKNFVNTISNLVEDFDVFYADRCSPGIDLLKETFKKKNGWVIFEPNSTRNFSAFIKNALNSHIVKFSSERISISSANKLKEAAAKSAIVLIIHTIGKDGLYFCYRKKDKKISKWIHLPSQPLPNKVRDTSGAGDWCTTGLLHVLINNNRKVKKWLPKEEIISSLQYGQALAAISCAFIGAQGLIYANDINENKDNNESFKNIFNHRNNNIKPVYLPKKTGLRLCNTCLMPTT